MVSEASHPSTQSGPTPGFATRVTYGIGAAAYGIKDGGFNYFLLMFYGTVVGLEPGLVGLAIFIALVLDALSDPMVGYISDNWHSRWGRRHPFMYAAAIPVAISYFALWNPPDWSQTGLFVYLVILAVLIRTFITLYETPSSSLLAELSADYDERTRLISYRQLFGWVSGAAMSTLMYGVLLVSTSDYPIGSLNRDGYALYGVIASLLMFTAIVVSSLGTHQYIPHLPPAPPRRSLKIRHVFGEIYDTLADRSFTALFVAALFGSIASGMTASLHYLMYHYFWGFSREQIFFTTLLVPLSAIGGFLLAPRVARWFGKRRAVIGLGVIAFTAVPVLIWLRTAGQLPANGDAALFPLVATVSYIDLALVIAVQAIFGSMIADLVEHSELKTGRRSEGLFFAAVTFTRKATHGLGTLAAGIVLSLVAFPRQAAPADVPPDTLWTLGAIYAPVIFALNIAMIIAVSFYRIERGDHEANVAALAARKQLPAERVSTLAAEA